eukprot:COSAG02_NODE_2389_length_8985_cov_3.175676_7_plen_129_part_00
MALTCAEGTPEAKLPYCDRSLGFAARSADLVARLNQTDQQNLFFSYPGTPYIAKTNSKGWSLDHTCIHGLNKQNGVTVFPHVRLRAGLSSLMRAASKLGPDNWLLRRSGDHAWTHRPSHREHLGTVIS